ncbi:MAG: hypothetical protein ACLRVX_04605 [Faecalibacterium sp.]
MFIKRLHVFYIYFFCGGKFLLSVCKSIKPLPDAALCRSTPIHHTPDSYTKRELVGAGSLHLAYARPFGRLKAPLGLSLLRFAAQTRTTLFLLCTKSCIVWRKIGVWCSFYWKFIKRKSQKLLGTSRSFRLCYLKIGNLLLNRLHRGDGQGRLTNGFISLYKPIHAASFFLLPYVTLRNSPQPTGNLV